MAEKENALAMQTISYEMGNRKFEIKESMALQELLMVPCTHRKVEQSVPQESEGEGPGHGIPEEQQSTLQIVTAIEHSAFLKSSRALCKYIFWLECTWI